MRQSIQFLSAGVVAGTAMSLGGCERTQTMATSPAAVTEATVEDRSADAEQPRTAIMYVHGMGCPQCAYNVDLQLLKVRGVEDVKVDMSTGRVIARLSETNPPTREQLARAIRQTGFTLVRIEMQ